MYLIVGSRYPPGFYLSYLCAFLLLRLFDTSSSRKLRNVARRTTYLQHYDNCDRFFKHNESNVDIKMKKKNDRYYSLDFNIVFNVIDFVEVIVISRLSLFSVLLSSSLSSFLPSNRRDTRDSITGKRNVVVENACFFLLFFFFFFFPQLIT